ncbi:protein phosphatase 2C family protein [Artemisia annua]|uniref:Protein phosphatase 2C family protein n=1 Tax=Artemisia annua TaxID=35608 RepID=A0A2U1PA67_ARTAN|nr:protein phosphatase 2C family protein [Artemisia annua]
MGEQLKSFESFRESGRCRNSFHRSRCFQYIGFACSSKVANFCAERMHEVIAEEWDQEAQKWEALLSSSFERADNEVLTEAAAPEIVGSTAIVSVLSGCQIIVSKCGESRAVLCRGTETSPLTVDQKPDREDELLRIEKQDGKVIYYNGARVLGVLAMSRAIGISYITFLYRIFRHKQEVTEIVKLEDHPLRDETIMTNSGKNMIWDLNSILVSESNDLNPAKGQLVIDASINQQRKRLRNKVANFCVERMHEVIAEEWDQEAVDCFKWKQKWEAVLSSSFEMADNEVLSRGLSYLAAKSSYPNVVNHEQCCAVEQKLVL